MKSLLATLDPAKVAQLDPAEQALIHRLVAAEDLLSSPATFAAKCSHGLWKPYRHLAYTSNRIVDMIERDTCDLLIVEQPVRHGKTELCSRWTPAWYVLRYGGTVGLASYEADFAATHGRRAREIVTEWGPRFGVEIDNTSKASHRWEVKGHKGGMWAAGAGGPITGKGAELLIVDDPIKSAEEADSQVMRDNLWDWWLSTFLTRREPKAKVVVIMSRWHTDDLVARLLRNPGTMRIERVRLPALAEEGDALGRREGEALCPERYNAAELADKREQHGPRVWAAMYQQRPVLAGGAMFKRQHFRYYTRHNRGDETFNILGETTVDDADCWRFATMDPAYTARRKSDYTVLCVWAVAPTDPPALMLLDVRRVRVQATDHVPMVESAWEMWQPAWIGIEKQAANQPVFDEIKRRGVVVIELNPYSRNKYSRAESAAALVESGRVFFPESAPWLGEFEDEILNFPVGAYDDQVDCLAYAGIEFVNGHVHARRRRREFNTLEERAWRTLERRERRSRYHPVMGRI